MNITMNDINDVTNLAANVFLVVYILWVLFIADDALLTPAKKK